MSLTWSASQSPSASSAPPPAASPSGATQPPLSPRSPRRGLFRYRAEKSPKAWLFLLPALIFVVLFSVLPLVRTFVMAFQSNSILHPKPVGWKNFLYVLKDAKFYRALGNTAIYAIFIVPLGLLLALFIALILNSKIKGTAFFETIFFFPYITSIIAIGIVFRYLLNGDYGFFNQVLSWIGLGPYDFLDNPDLNMAALIIFGVWSSLAFNIIILLSGLRNIDPYYYKVADMFGASQGEKLWKITLPQLLPIITFLTISSFINAFKVYSQVYSLFNGRAGIGNRAMTAVFYVYNKFYVEQRYGHGMAAAVILFILILLFTLLQRWILKRLAR